MPPSFSEQIREIKSMLDEGLLTEAEFQEEKRAIMAARRGTTPAAPASPLSGATTISTPDTPAIDPLAGKTTITQPVAAGPPDQIGSYKVLGVIGEGVWA